MSAMQAKVSPVGPQEVERATAVLTLAFADDPVVRWSYPTAQAYLTRFPNLIRAFGKEAFDHGTARVVNDGAGAALWLPPPLHPDEDALEAVLENDLPDEVRDDANALFGEMATYHPSEPHWYLPLIGVDPIAQGRGHGSSLLKEALGRCDHDHVCVYLESTNPKNIPFYERHSFEVLGTIKAGAAPPMTPMLRRAR